ncbi:hypothetical protein LUZ60_012951 [Juncus effusus]|nr:hypothetical protein LUZ60_012951 [Juncus effusus]
MRRQGGQYMDPNQMQQQQQQQYNNYASYPAPTDPLRPGGDAYNYVAPSRPLDAQQQQAQQHWNWDPNNTGYTEGQANVASQAALYDAQRQDSNLGQQKAQTPPTNNANNKLQTAGYEDINNNINASIPQTIDSLEQKFLQDINKLSKEHNEAEDSEISRHRERLNEITAQYHEKLTAIRSQHLKLREEFAKKEAQFRFQQYQQYSPNPAPAPMPSGPHHAYPVPYGAELAQQQRPPAYPVPYGAELAGQQYPPGGYGGGEVQHRPPYPGPAGQYGYEYPGGRGYNAGGRPF